jgi:RNA polymerase sigma-70 factor (ECF subfamily)
MMEKRRKQYSRYFLNVYRSIDQFDAQKGPLTTWLLQFAYHRAINRREHLVSKRFYDSEQLDEEWVEGHQGEVGERKNLRN